MPTPNSVISRRGIEPFWVATWRERARGHLNDVRRAIWDAEHYFDLAVSLLKEGDSRAATEYLDLAFRSVESAHYARKRAKADALMAICGTPLEYWTAERRRMHRIERESWLARMV